MVMEYGGVYSRPKKGKPAFIEKHILQLFIHKNDKNVDFYIYATSLDSPFLEFLLTVFRAGRLPNSAFTYRLYETTPCGSIFSFHTYSSL